MTLEDKFFNFFTKDTYILQNIGFIDDDLLYINFLLRKKETTEKERKIICCFLSAIVYEQNTTMLNFNDEYEIYTMENGLRYGIFYINGYMYIVFKGSSTLKDFISNVNIKLIRTKYFPGKVHNGFCDLLLDDKNYRSVFKNLKTFTQKHKFSHIYVTGHSLGGALSSLFYSLCKRYKFFKKYEFLNITFGSPRVGNTSFCRNLFIERIINGADIVPMLPFPLCYRHLDKKTHINYKFAWPSITDHDIASYYKHLKKTIS